MKLVGKMGLWECFLIGFFLRLSINLEAEEVCQNNWDCGGKHSVEKSLEACALGTEDLGLNPGSPPHVG